MSRNSVIVKREKTLAEQIIIVLLVALLMAGFLYYFLKQEKQYTQVAFEGAVGRFATKVTTIRAQWFMDKQPSVVRLKEQGNQKTTRLITVNKNGWVDSLSNNKDCTLIWEQVMDSPLEFMNKPVTALQINIDKGAYQRICRYILVSGEYFEYSPETGKVSNILIINTL